MDILIWSKMKEKLTVIKVGGKIVEEADTLNQLLTDFSRVEGYKVLVHEEDVRLRRWLPGWGLKARW